MISKYASLNKCLFSSEFFFLLLNGSYQFSFQTEDWKYSRIFYRSSADVLVVVEVVLAFKHFVFKCPSLIHCVYCLPRQLFSIASYFFFFYNIILGVFAGLFRILKAMLLGVLFMARIDRPLLMQGYQTWDKGSSNLLHIVAIVVIIIVINIFVIIIVDIIVIIIIIFFITTFSGKIMGKETKTIPSNWESNQWLYNC